jgi:hypothetical protein
VVRLCAEPPTLGAVVAANDATGCSTCRPARVLITSLCNHTIEFSNAMPEGGHRLCRRFIADKHQRADKESKDIDALHV